MIQLIESVCIVTGVMVVCSPVCWLILQVGNKVERYNKKNNKSQAKRNR